MAMNSGDWVGEPLALENNGNSWNIYSIMRMILQTRKRLFEFRYATYPAMN